MICPECTITHAPEECGEPFKLAVCQFSSGRWYLCLRWDNLIFIHAILAENAVSVSDAKKRVNRWMMQSIKRLRKDHPDLVVGAGRTTDYYTDYCYGASRHYELTHIELLED